VITLSSISWEYSFNFQLNDVPPEPPWFEKCGSEVCLSKIPVEKNSREKDMVIVK